MIITRKNQKFSVECVKFVKTYQGVRVYLFRNLFPLMGHEYIVAVKKDADTMLFSHFKDIKSALNAYLENVCCYA